MTGKLQPAFWGGLFIGVLSGLPFVKMGNVCCCLWVVSGGVLAVWLAQSNQPQPVRAADGALLGLVAGIIGAIVVFPLNLAFESFERGMVVRLLESTEAELPPEFREMLENTSAGMAARLFAFFFNLIMFTIFGLLGGLLGSAMFKKEAPPPPPGTVEVLPPLGPTGNA
jgi:uncharacterized membrane protein YeaQ/YmgE (transglycosylase-associated protein family)